MNKLPKKFYTIIRKYYPTILESEITVFDDGMDYLVCVVNNKHAFRFPRRDDYAKTLPREVAFLDTFASRSPIPIPQMKLYFSTESNPYVQYDFISGVPFEITLAKQFTQEENKIIAQQLGAFITALHSFPLTEAQVLGIPQELPNWQERLHRAKQTVFPFMSNEEQTWIITIFSRFFEIIQDRILPSRLVHGDIMPRHIIVNDKEHTLAGIIDFGEIRIFDPAYEFAFLGIYGNEFLQEVYRNYALERDDTFEARGRFYESRSYIAALEYSLRTEDKEKTELNEKKLHEFITTHPLA